MWLQHFYGEWWPGSGGVLSNFAFRFNLRFCCLQICSDCGLYQESIDINSANHYPRSLYGERLFRNDPFRLPITFSTHAPHAGSDSRPIIRGRSNRKFLSTLPMRGATANMKYFIHICNSLLCKLIIFIKTEV